MMDRGSRGGIPSLGGKERSRQTSRQTDRHADHRNPQATYDATDAFLPLPSARRQRSAACCEKIQQQQKQKQTKRKNIGPAILIQDVSTVVVEPGCIATVSPFGDVAIDVGDVTAAGGGGDGSNSGGGRKRVKRELDPVYLSIFAHRFMGIAEQMGRTLQVFIDSSIFSIHLSIYLRIFLNCVVIMIIYGILQ